MRRRGIGSRWAATGRLRRRCGLDRNDLRRDVDRKQRSIAIGLVVLYLATAPLAALWLAGIIYDRGRHTEVIEAATRHQVTATVLLPGSLAYAGHAPTLVAWTGQDGNRHTGVPVTWRGRADLGERQRIWVDADERPTTVPRGRTQTLVDGWSAGLATLTGVVIPFVAVHAIIRHRFDRRRDHDWDRAWARFDSHSAS